MKKYSFTFTVVFILLIASACDEKSASPKITEDEAETIVLEHLTGDFNRDENEITIQSVSNSSGKYIVEWEVDKDCEYGTVQVDDQSGEIIEAMETNC
ncbi:hypothetical protein [Ornithinibacillus halophilus]|uniref:Peptidase propeptide and YPEB domain-containing protein n=1 Tax=Ornithinibacillus halophilus TaxID=930117 RepID=A0A1M5JZ00_9BACI|nr:hypothetical protein [Ornithinibacillus halophilus]SHG45738.1 hypothetical protein SAMN05216225_103428 [Ornithinibacillus halophilus]